MKTICYIDGLNLFHTALKGTKFKWLDLELFLKNSLPEGVEVSEINYYTARVTGRVDPEAPVNQHSYLKALTTLLKVKTHLGTFLVTKKWTGLVTPYQFKPEGKLTFEGDEPKVAYTWKTEEKGSDVNLGVHLVRDAALKKIDTAIIISNDTDFLEAVRIVREEFGVKIILLAPTNAPSRTLKAMVDEVRYVKRFIDDSQFSDEVLLSDGKKVKKPVGW